MTTWRELSLGDLTREFLSLYIYIYIPTHNTETAWRVRRCNKIGCKCTLTHKLVMPGKKSVSNAKKAAAAAAAAKKDEGSDAKNAQHDAEKVSGNKKNGGDQEKEGGNAKVSEFKKFAAEQRRNQMKIRRARLEKVKAEENAKSAKYLKLLLFVWFVVVAVVVVHIASVINTGYAVREGRPIPEHYLMMVWNPFYRVIAPAVEPLLELLEPMFASIRPYAGFFGYRDPATRTFPGGKVRGNQYMAPDMGF